MTNLVNKLRRIVSTQTENNSSPENFKFLKSPKSILHALIQSKETRTVVGLYLPGLGDGMFLTSVENIIMDDDEKIAVLIPYELSGQILQRTHFSINEIRSVCAFSVAYKNPFFKTTLIG